MAKRRAEIAHAKIVARFASQLRSLRLSRGFTQAELGRAASVTASYIARLERSGAAPGIDLVERLASALGVSVHELLPIADIPDSTEKLRDRAKSLYEGLLAKADSKMLELLCELVARLGDSVARRK